MVFIQVSTHLTLYSYTLKHLNDTKQLIKISTTILVIAVAGAQAGPLHYGYAAPSLVAAPGSNALPVVTSPLLATTGYAVGASGAIGGQTGLVTLLGRRKREAAAPVAVPVVSLPAEATAGYAVGASGAVGGQEGVDLPAVAPLAVSPVISYAALPLAPALGYAGLPYFG